MSDLSSNAAYTQRFNAVLTYIEANLEGDLSVKALSQVANFSAFHCHRQFTTFVGVPVSGYVQLMRLRRAAHGLSSLADYSVLEAALSAGFESPEAFSWVFRRAFGWFGSIVVELIVVSCLSPRGSYWPGVCKNPDTALKSASLRKICQ